MKATENHKIAVIGAGIAGLSAAIMLDRQGHTVEIFEASPTVRGIGAGLGLASNGMKAFEYLGLAQEVIAISNRLTDFNLCDVKGTPFLSIDTERIKKSFKVDNFAVHRSDLHRLLQQKLPREKIHVRKKLVSLKNDRQHVTVEFEDGGEKVFDFVIGADGVNSQVRQNLMPQSQPQFAGYWCWRGIVDYSLKNPDTTEAVWAKKGRFGYTPLSEDKVYWFACINTTSGGKVSAFDLQDLKENFKNYYPLVPALLDKTKNEDIISAPIVDIDPIAKYHFHRTLLIGDAAHAATPNMGQGACLAIEDVAVLQDELQKRNSFQEAFKNFESRRLSRTHYIMINSRRAGKIAQSEQGFVNRIRNSVFRLLPNSITQRPLKRLLDEDFMEV